MSSLPAAMLEPALPGGRRVPGPGLCFGLGLLVTLVLGAGLGAWNLLDADWSLGTVTGESVLIHAHAQIFGFVLFFVIGIVGHAVPRLSHRPIDRPARLWVAFSATLFAQLLFPIGVLSHAESLQRAAEALDVLAAATVAGTVWVATRHTPESLRPWLRLGAGSLLLATAWGLAGALDQRLLVHRAALWQLALWGFIAPFILGMSYHILDMAGGFEVRPREESWLATAWASAVAARVAAELGLLPAFPGEALQLVVAASVAWQLGLFRPLRRPRRGMPFFASAYASLLLSLLLSCLQGSGLLPDHQLIEDASRHTFTIGCVTQMIVGVALRALPVAGGVELAFPALSTLAWGLLNGAVALRLGRVLAATLTPGALRFSGVSGLLALGCLVCFAVCLIGTVRRVLSKLRAAKERAPGSVARTP